MKQSGFLLLILILAVSCTKIKVERYDPVTNTPVQDSLLSDSTSTIVGYQLKTTHVPVNQLLDISSSSQISDSASYTVIINNYEAIRITARKDSTTDSLSTGIYFTVLKNLVRIGMDCQNGYYAFKFRDTISFNQLCSEGYTNPNTIFNRNFAPVEVPIYRHAETPTGEFSNVVTWNPMGKSRGYLCFRFVNGFDVKYGWIQLDVLSTGSVKVVDYAYQD